MSLMKDNQVPALEMVKYFLFLDLERKYFVVEKMIKAEGNSVPTVGNLRLNKLLRITQILYADKEEEYLFPEKMWAFEQGGVIYEVYRQFHFLVNPQNHPPTKGLGSTVKIFLTKIFNYFKTYTNQQLEKFVHEDPAWFTIRDKKNIRGGKEMSQSPKMIKYYQNFALHIVEKIEL